MNNYAYFNEAGEPCYTASYCSDDDVPADPVGYRSALITDEVFPDFYLTEEGIVVVRATCPSINHTWDANALDWVIAPDRLQIVKATSAIAIDVAAGRARQRFITTVPGQDSTYTAKYQEALAYIAADYPSDLTAYPFIAGESVPNSTLTPTQAATRIATLGSYWRGVIGPAIESARINGKDDLEGLASIEEVDAHVASVIATLEAI